MEKVVLKEIDFTKILYEIAKVNFCKLYDVLNGNELQVMNFINDDSDVISRRVDFFSDQGRSIIKIKVSDNFNNISLNVNVETSKKIMGILNKNSSENVVLNYSKNDNFLDITGYVIDKKHFGKFLNFSYSTKRDIFVVGKVKNMKLSL